MEIEASSPKKEKIELNLSEKSEKKSEKKLNNEEELEKIENYLKKKLNKISPTLYIEYPKNNEVSPLSKIDLENLRNILIKFGKINFIEVYRLISIVQFDTFFSAYSCIKYFEKINNKKTDTNNKIICRFFEEKDEEKISEEIISKIKKLKPYEIVDNINKSMKNYYIKKKYEQEQEEEENTEKENILTDPISNLQSYSVLCLSKKAQKEFNDIISLNKFRGLKNIELNTNLNNINNNYIPKDYNEKCNNIKYICKFFLQIEGDKEFNVIKRIIGAKGSNIKRIIDYCSKGPGGIYVPDAIKLKLKGIGSGYKEKENDKKENLNLCVISKYPDKYKKACSFVVELIINIYEEYKRFCDRKKKKPITSLNIQKVEYISTRGC